MDDREKMPLAVLCDGLSINQVYMSIGLYIWSSFYYICK